MIKKGLSIGALRILSKPLKSSPKSEKGQMLLDLNKKPAAKDLPSRPPKRKRKFKGYSPELSDKIKKMQADEAAEKIKKKKEPTTEEILRDLSEKLSGDVEISPQKREALQRYFDFLDEQYNR